MIKFTLTLALTILLSSLGLNAQNNIDNQYFVYTTHKEDHAAVDNAAFLLNSIVLEYSGPEQHLALLEWDGTPIIDGAYTLNTMVDIMEKIKGNTPTPPIPDVDGGTINEDFNPIKGPGSSTAKNRCYAPLQSADLNAAQGVTIGIFDTGLNYEIAQNNGYNFESVLPLGGDVTDSHGHGTHIGTIIDDIYHKYIKNIPLNYVIGSSFDENGQSTLFNLVASVEDAMHIGGIDVMNFSFSYTGDTPEGDAFYLLLDSPIAEDILFVTAAGNDAFDLDGNTPAGGASNQLLTYFPAAFDLPNILSVGSFGCGGKQIKIKSDFSNYGTTSVDFGAPGEDIKGLDEKGELVAMSGTSQATAVVSGTATVALALNDHLTTEELKCALISFGDDTPSFALEFKYARAVNVNNIIAADIPACTLQNEQGQSGGGLTSSSEEIYLSTNIFPNPISDILHIEYSASVDSELTFEVYSFNGQLISTIREQAYKGNNDFSINFNNITFNNQYILRIISNDKIDTRKISRF